MPPEEDKGDVDGFVESLRKLINTKSMERRFGDVPDYILAEFMADCAAAFGKAVENLRKQEGK
jgi:hypothetical protein